MKTRILPNKLILRSLYSVKKYLLFLFLVGFLSMLVLGIYVSCNETNKFNVKKNYSEIYGEYDYGVVNANDTEKDILLNRENIEKYVLVKQTFIKKFDEYINYIYIDEDSMRFTNIRIIEGNFPSKENEVAVQKNDIISLGLIDNDYIGKKITIVNPTTGHNEEKIISGVYSLRYASATNNMDYKSGYLFNDKYATDNVSYRIYIKLKNNNLVDLQIKKMIKEIYAKYKKDLINTFIINEKLLTYENALSSQCDNKISELVMNNIIIVVIVMVIFISLNTIISICLYKWQDVITTYKLLGAKMIKIKLSICILVNLGLALGMLVGIFASYLISYMIIKCSLTIFKLNNIFKMIFPFRYIMLFMLVSIILINVFVFIKLRIVDKLSASELQLYFKNTYRKDIKNKNCVFQKINSKCNVVRLSIVNLWYHKKRKVLMIFLLCVSIMLLTVLTVKLKSSIKEKDNNDIFRYRLDIERDLLYNNEKYYQQALKLSKNINSYFNSRKQILYYKLEKNNTLFLNKKYMSNQYKNFLKKDIRKMAKMNEMDFEGFDTNVSIMGYSDDMVKELYKLNNKQYHKLEPNTALVLSNTLEGNINKSFKINPMIGEKYSFNSNELEEDYKVTVIDSIEKLIVYPESKESTLCIIIPLEDFLTNYSDGYIENTYIKDMDEDTKNGLLSLVSGINIVNFQDKFYEHRQEQSCYYQTILIVVFVFLLCILTALINYRLIMSYEITIRAYEYALLKALGVSEKVLFVESYIESFFVFLLGLLLGEIGSLMCLKIMYKYYIIDEINISLSTVLILMISMVGFMLSLIKISRRQISKINILDGLSN